MVFRSHAVTRRATVQWFSPTDSERLRAILPSSDVTRGDTRTLCTPTLVFRQVYEQQDLGVEGVGPGRLGRPGNRCGVAWLRVAGRRSAAETADHRGVDSDNRCALEAAFDEEPYESLDYRRSRWWSWPRSWESPGNYSPLTTATHTYTQNVAFDNYTERMIKVECLKEQNWARWNNREVTASSELYIGYNMCVLSIFSFIFFVSSSFYYIFFADYMYRLMPTRQLFQSSQ